MKKKFEANRVIIIVVRLLFLLEFIAPVFIWFVRGGGSIKLINMFTALLGLALTFLPEAVERVSRRKLRFSSAFSCVIVLFIFCAEFLGEINNFYFIVPWWDTMLHTMSGVIIGLIGFMLVYVLNESERTNVNLSPGFVCFFAFCFAMAAGAVWEIFEFSGDRLFNMNMQKFRPLVDDIVAAIADGWRYDEGLIDTMEDIICDASSAFVTSAVGYIFLKIRWRRGVELNSKNSVLLGQNQEKDSEVQNADVR